MLHKCRRFQCMCRLAQSTFGKRRCSCFSNTVAALGVSGGAWLLVCSSLPIITHYFSKTRRTLEVLQRINKTCGGMFSMRQYTLLCGGKNRVSWDFKKEDSMGEKKVATTWAFKQHNLGIFISVRQVNNFVRRFSISVDEKEIEDNCSVYNEAVGWMRTRHLLRQSQDCLGTYVDYFRKKKNPPNLGFSINRFIRSNKLFANYAAREQDILTGKLSGE